MKDPERKVCKIIIINIDYFVGSNVNSVGDNEVKITFFSAK